MSRNRPSPIRVFISSTRLLWSSGLGALLRDHTQIRVAGVTTDPPENVDSFDILLWDAVDTSPQSLPFRFVAILASSQNARAWLDGGAAGVLWESSSVEELFDALFQVAHGDTYIPRVVMKDVLQRSSANRKVPMELIEPLTDREQEVLRLLAQGLSNKDIAQKLYLSVRTVEGHMANIYGKLQVKSRTEAALWAAQHRI